MPSTYRVIEAIASDTQPSKRRFRGLALPVSRNSSHNCSTTLTGFRHGTGHSTHPAPSYRLRSCHVIANLVAAVQAVAAPKSRRRRPLLRDENAESLAVIFSRTTVLTRSKMEFSRSFPACVSEISTIVARPLWIIKAIDIRSSRSVRNSRFFGPKPVYH